MRLRPRHVPADIVKGAVHGVNVQEDRMYSRARCRNCHLMIDAPWFIVAAGSETHREAVARGSALYVCGFVRQAVMWLSHSRACIVRGSYIKVGKNHGVITAGLAGPIIQYKATPT